MNFVLESFINVYIFFLIFKMCWLNTLEVLDSNVHNGWICIQTYIGFDFFFIFDIINNQQSVCAKNLMCMYIHFK